MTPQRFCRLALPELNRAEPVWEPRADVPALGPEEIQLWLVDLDQCRETAGTLNPAEQDRAQSFRFEVDRRRFIQRRAMLRELVGAYLEQPPAKVSFQTTIAGKLSVAGEVQFNLSSAGELALYGFVRGRAIGVDVAYCRPDFQWPEIAASFFHPTEAGYLAGLPAPEQCRAFFRLWTIKEALVKADGGGLGQPLAREDFTPQIRDGVRTRGRWRWLGWAPTATTVAALVVEA